MEGMTETKAPELEWVQPGDTSIALARPIDVIPAQIQDRIDRSVEEGMAIEKVDADNLKSVVEKMNFLGKHITWVKKRITDLRRPINEIADLLGHRSIDTTAIYVKVALPQLADVALPFPGAAS